MKTKKKAAARAKITSVSISRLYNLGNYQNVKYDLTAEVPVNGSAAAVFAELYEILYSLRPLLKPSCMDRLDKVRKKTESQQSEYEKAHLQEWQEEVNAFNERKRRRDLAVQKLDELGGTSISKDAKTTWDDEEAF